MFGLFDDLLDLLDDQSEFWTGRPLLGGSRAPQAKRPDPNAHLRARVEALERAELERRCKAAEHAAAKAQEEARAADAKAREIEEADAAEIARLMALRGLEAMIAGEAAPKPKKED